MNILIAVPTFETIYPDTFKSIYDLDTGAHETHFEFVRGYDCATARNRIAQKAQNMGVDYVLMIDNDVTVPRDGLLNLLDGEMDVVLGYYPHRNADNEYNGNTCVCRLESASGERYVNYPLESEYTASEMRSFRDAGKFKIQIHGGGMGCALIRTDVFHRIRYPWYDWVNYKGETRAMLSEDLYFCEQLKHKQIPIYTDSRVGCGHMFRKIQYPD